MTRYTCDRYIHFHNNRSNKTQKHLVRWQPSTCPRRASSSSFGVYFSLQNGYRHFNASFRHKIRKDKQVRFVSSFVTTTTITTPWCNETLYMSISTHGSRSTILVIVMGLVTGDVHDSTRDFLFLFFRDIWMNSSSFFHHVRDTPSVPHLSSEEQISAAFCYAGTSVFQLNSNKITLNHDKQAHQDSVFCNLIWILQNELLFLYYHSKNHCGPI